MTRKAIKQQSKNRRTKGRRWALITSEKIALGMTCELELTGCTGRITEGHHWLPVARGGRFIRANHKGVCRNCHTLAHSVDYANEPRVLLHSWDAPREIGGTER